MAYRMDFVDIRPSPPRERLLLLWNSIQRILPDLNANDSTPTEYHENAIRRHYNQLLSNLNVPDVATQMFQNGKLTAKEHEHLRQFHSTPIRASEELLNFLLLRSRDVYECFLESLKKTKQQHVYQMLTSNEESVCIDEQSTCMSEHSRLLRENYDWLTEKLDSDSGLLRTLYAREVLSHREYIKIISEMDQFVRNEIILGTISRKSFEDFTKFIIALKDTSQEYIAIKLTERPVDVEKLNMTTKVEKILQITSFHSSKKRIPPKPPPKPKKQPLIEATTRLSKADGRQNFSKHDVLRKQSVEFLKVKFKKLPNELQTEVSTKMFLIHQRKSTKSIWNIAFNKILDESRNIKSHNMMQSKRADENCERLMQEIAQREYECKMIKQDIQLEKSRTQKQLKELQDRVHDLQDRLDLKQTENKTLVEKLRNSEDKLERLKILLLAENENIDIVEILESQLTFLGIKFRETEEHLRVTRDRLIEKEHALRETTSNLEKVQEILKETEDKKNEAEAQVIVLTKEYKVALTLLNHRKDREVNEMASTMEILQSQTIQSEENLKQMKTRLFSTEKYMENEFVLKATAADLEETKEKLKDLETKLTETEGKLIVTEKVPVTVDLKSEAKVQYKAEPDVVHIIRKTAAEERNHFFGMTILDKELFVVSYQSSEIDVYDSTKLGFSRQWKLKELINPLDIGSCNRNKCLYILNYRDGKSNKILRVDRTGKLIKRWSTGEDWGYGLSVTEETNVLSTVYNNSKLKEYSSDGELLREINLSLHAGIHHPFYAIKLGCGNFLVSHGDIGDKPHRVCIVDEDGKLMTSFGGKPGSSTGQLLHPFYFSVDGNGSVMVADQRNDRVLLLNSDLEFRREIISSGRKHRLKHPTKILLDELNGRLFVTDRESNISKILIFNLR